ncbi:MAG TPA: hypothetical protein VJI52_05805 [Candidatus Nanoarchaeia archaeon]|nr:hypothetical protein [Candidatus Nanoarchaeia archaeon]
MANGIDERVSESNCNGHSLDSVLQLKSVEVGKHGVFDVATVTVTYGGQESSGVHGRAHRKSEEVVLGATRDAIMRALGISVDLGDATIVHVMDDNYWQEVDMYRKREAVAQLRRDNVVYEGRAPVQFPPLDQANQQKATIQAYFNAAMIAARESTPGAQQNPIAN